MARPRRFAPPVSFVPAEQAASPIRPEHIPGVRAKLRALGYNVDATGPMTARLLRAWRNYRFNVHGLHGLSVKAWNKSNPLGKNTGNDIQTITRERGSHEGLVAKVAKVTKTHVRAKKAAKTLGAGTGMGGPGGNNFPGVPKPPSGGADVNAILPRSMADQLAGLQFDPQIQQVMTQINQGKRDEAQHQTDIGHWYGQVEGAQGTARERDAAAAASARGSTTDAIQSILQSLGGSRGAGVVGAAGVNDLAGLAAQGQAQDQYNSDLAPLLRQEEAGAHSRELALGSQRASALDTQLTGLRGQRGQAQAQALMQIIQANNQARQGNFGNRLALQNAALAAASLGLDADKTNAMLQQYGLSNQYNRAKLRALQQQNKAASGHPNWALLNPVDRQTLIDNAIKTAAGQLPQGIWDPGAVTNAALATLRAGGYGSARKNSFVRRGGHVPSRANQAAILALLQQRMAYYHGQHPQQ